MPAREGEERKVEYKQRAEIVRFNECYGTRQELMQQFGEVMKLNQNVCEPYLHVVMGLPPRDRLTNSQWSEVAKGCAKALDFEDHQYVAIVHKDTSHQHMHLLVNRIGFEGEVVEDHYMLPRICAYCRRTEKEYELMQLKGPRRYQTEEQRREESQDQRVRHLKQSIEHALGKAYDYPAFQEEMAHQGYRIYRNEKGIAFYKEKLITHTGSEAGYPWKKIAQQLEENEQLRQEQALRALEEARRQGQELRLEQQQDYQQRQHLGYRPGL
jgi:MobA/VirD2-like, nuclease domain